MSKLCMQRRERRRTQLSKRYKERRDELRAIIGDADATLAEKEAAQEKIQKLPRDSSVVRGRRRCWKTGRPHGVYRLVGLCRNMFRKHAMEGDIPGLHKASW